MLGELISKMKLYDQSQIKLKQTMDDGSLRYEHSKDIEEAFSALDTSFLGALSIENVHTIFLGLGYQPESTTVEQLRLKSCGKETFSLQETEFLLKQVGFIFCMGERTYFETHSSGHVYS